MKEKLLTKGVREECGLRRYSCRILYILYRQCLTAHVKFYTTQHLYYILDRHTFGTKIQKQKKLYWQGGRGDREHGNRQYRLQSQCRGTRCLPEPGGRPRQPDLLASLPAAPRPPARHHAHNHTLLGIQVICKIGGWRGSSSSIIDPDQVYFEQTRRFGYRNRLIIHYLPYLIQDIFNHTFSSRTKLISRWSSFKTTLPILRALPWFFKIESSQQAYYLNPFFKAYWDINLFWAD